MINHYEKKYNSNVQKNAMNIALFSLFCFFNETSLKDLRLAICKLIFRLNFYRIDILRSLLAD